MGIVIENYIFNNLRSLLLICIGAFESLILIKNTLLRLCFTSNGPLTIRGETRELEKNFPDIY